MRTKNEIRKKIDEMVNNRYRNLRDDVLQSEQFLHIKPGKDLGMGWQIDDLIKCHAIGVVWGRFNQSFSALDKPEEFAATALDQILYWASYLPSDHKLSKMAMIAAVCDEWRYAYDWLNGD